MRKINSTFERLSVIAFWRNHSDFHLSVSIHSLKKTYTRLMKFEGRKKKGGWDFEDLYRIKNYISTGICESF